MAAAAEALAGVAGGDAPAADADEPREADDDDDDDDEAAAAAADDHDSYAWFAPGKEHMLHAVWDDELGVLKPCHGTTDGHIADNHVFRYHRHVGFLRHNQAVLDADDALAEIYRDLRCNTKKAKSYNQRVERFSMFLRYILDRWPGHSYCAYIRKLNDDALQHFAAFKRRQQGGAGVALELPARVAFELPPEELCAAWALNLRKDEAVPYRPAHDVDHCAGTIKQYLAKISATVTEYLGKDVPSPSNAAIIREKLSEWEEHDVVGQSATFEDLPKDLVTLWDTCMGMSHWNWKTKVLVWAMALTQFNMAGRNSCITKYCSLYEDMVVPPSTAWDENGLPPWLELGQRAWKGRKANATSRFGLRLHRNRVDPRFCPVAWILLAMEAHDHPGAGYPVFGRWQSPKQSSKKSSDELQEEEDLLGAREEEAAAAEKEPAVFGALTEDAWTNATTRILTVSGFYKPAVGKPHQSHYQPPSGVTNHGWFRAGGAQWAFRCGANLLQVKNMGRWRALDVCAHYLAQGSAQSDLATTGPAGYKGEVDDPLQRVWWWRPVAQRSVNGKDLV